MTALAGQDQPRAARPTRPAAAEHPGPATTASGGVTGSGEKAGRIVAPAVAGAPREEAGRRQAPGRKPGPGLRTRCRRPRPHAGRDGEAQEPVPPAAGRIRRGDRYGPDGAIDWSDIPPWRQTSFFGIRARGQFFVYVVDCSGSMIDDDRLPRATIELRRSVFALQEPQRFEVIFYNDESIPMPGGPMPRTADLQAKNQLLPWLRLIEPDGGTDPRPAMKQALSLRPDAVFLLSDGAFPDGTVDEVTSSTRGRSRSTASTSPAAWPATISSGSPRPIMGSTLRGWGICREGRREIYLGRRVRGFTKP